MMSDEVYRTTENMTHPMRVATASGVSLAPVGLADIQRCDVILVIAKTTGDSSEGDGLAAVTKFGTFGVYASKPSEPPVLVQSRSNAAPSRRTLCMSLKLNAGLDGVPRKGETRLPLVRGCDSQ